MFFFFFFFQAEDGIRDIGVTGVQTCALPISIIPEARPRNCESSMQIKMLLSKLILEKDRPQANRIVGFEMYA